MPTLKLIKETNAIQDARNSKVRSGPYSSDSYWSARQMNCKTKLITVKQENYTIQTTRLLRINTYIAVTGDTLHDRTPPVV